MNPLSRSTTATRTELCGRFFAAAGWSLRSANISYLGYLAGGQKGRRATLRLHLLFGEFAGGARLSHHPAAVLYPPGLAGAVGGRPDHDMASRTKQKEEARARRLAEEQAAAERGQRQRRMLMLGGVLVIAIAIVAVAIAISSSGGSSSNAGSAAANPKTPQQQQQATQVSNQVNRSLSGIHQSGVTLGSPKAPVTVTEYGDLQCPVCRDFALNAENQLISNEVR